MESKVIATTIDNKIMIFDSVEEYKNHEVELWNELFENSFTSDPEVMKRYGIEDKE